MTRTFQTQGFESTFAEESHALTRTKHCQTQLTHVPSVHKEVKGSLCPAVPSSSVGGLHSRLRTRSSHQLWLCYFLLTKRPADGPQTEVSVREEGRPGPPRLLPHSPGVHGHVPVVLGEKPRGPQSGSAGTWGAGLWRGSTRGERGWVNVHATPRRAHCQGARAHTEAAGVRTRPGH